VLTLALGIGANTVIFSLVNALLLRPLPGVEDPNRVVAVYTSDYSSGIHSTSSFPDYLDFRDKNDVFTGLAAFADSQPMNLALGGEPERVRGVIATGNYFSLLGVKAAIGRTLLPEDEQTPAADRVAVLSYDLWQGRLAGDPGVIGKTISINTQSFQVVGVAARGFRGTSLQSAPQVWVPMSAYTQLNPAFGGRDPLSRRGSRGLFMVARLKPEVSRQQAQAQIDIIAAQLADAYPQSNRGTLAHPDQPRPMTILPINEAMAGPRTRESSKRFSELLMVVVGIVLLIACANVANLMMARSRARQKEIAIRLAMGANRSRIVRQMLTESVLLSVAGGGAGLMLALWLSDSMKSLQMLAAFEALDLSPDFRVLAFTVLVSFATGVLFGLAPALHASRPSLIPALKGTDRDYSRGSRTLGFGNSLVVLQVALSLVLLIGAGLFIRSLQRVYTTDLGFNTGSALLASVDMARQGYTETQGRSFYRELLEQMQTLPGVRTATLAQYIPVNAGGSRTGVDLEGYTPQPDEDMELNFNIVDSGYFQTLGIPLIAGRGFDERDGKTANQVVIINEAMARRYWSMENAVGRRIRLDGSDGPQSEVIGVVRTGRYRGLREEPLPFIYVPLSQRYLSRMTVFVRTAGEPMALLPALRAEVQRLDKNLPLFDVRTLDSHLGIAFAQERTYAALIGGFALLAMLLAAVGLYGVMSYAVSQRTREIGIRMALGANQRDALFLVLSRSLKLGGLGIGAGLIGALALTQLVSSMLYGVSHTDAATFAFVAALLTVVLLAASYVPAYRATKVDPMIALRYE
jgi:predicted permease